MSRIAILKFELNSVAPLRELFSPLTKAKTSPRPSEIGKQFFLAITAFSQLHGRSKRLWLILSCSRGAVKYSSQLMLQLLGLEYPWSRLAQLRRSIPGNRSVRVLMGIVSELLPSGITAHRCCSPRTFTFSNSRGRVWRKDLPWKRHSTYLIGACRSVSEGGKLVETCHVLSRVRLEDTLSQHIEIQGSQHLPSAKEVCLHSPSCTYKTLVVIDRYRPIHMPF